MKKCPTCNRCYSDMVSVCPVCGTSLNGQAPNPSSPGPNPVSPSANPGPNPVSPSANPGTNPGSPSTNAGANPAAKTQKNSSSKAPAVLWGIVVVTVVFFVMNGLSSSYMGAAVAMGCLLGLIPRALARKHGKHTLGEIAWPVVALANTLFGFLASIPAVVVFVIISLMK